MTRRRRASPLLTHRKERRWSNRHAVTVIGGVVAVFVALLVAIVIRHEKYLAANASPFGVPWDASWPSLPDVRTAGALPVQLAQKVYAVVAKNEETLRHIPCYCGCRDQGHASVHHCHVKRRSAEGVVMEWDGHGRVCPLSADISGDAVFWRQQGTPIAQIRADIEREYSSRAPATPTPPVHRH
jgi:hypothetical protein